MPCQARVHGRASAPAPTPPPCVPLACVMPPPLAGSDMFWREPFNVSAAISNCNSTWGVTPVKLKAQTEWGGRRIEAASNIVVCGVCRWGAECRLLGGERLSGLRVCARRMSGGPPPPRPPALPLLRSASPFPCRTPTAQPPPEHKHTNTPQPLGTRIPRLSSSPTACTTHGTAAACWRTSTTQWWRSSSRRARARSPPAQPPTSPPPRARALRDWCSLPARVRAPSRALRQPTRGRRSWSGV